MGLLNFLELGNSGAIKRLELRYFGDPVLRQACSPVTDIDSEVREFAAALTEAMHRYDGVGLAAPQVGVSRRIIAVDTRPPDRVLPPTAPPGERLLTPLMPVALIDPEILEVSETDEIGEEGCLSFPQIYGPVRRPSSVVFRARLVNGRVVEGACGGLLARCLQHEIDHLNGVLFVDRIDETERRPLQDELRVLENETKRRLRQRQT